MNKEINKLGAILIENCKDTCLLIQKFYLIIFSMAFFFNSSLAYSQTEKEIEYKLKAVYILNFLQFTEWPDSIFENNNAPITVAILGKDPFGKIIDETVKDEKIGGHPILIKRFEDLTGIDSCRVVFICLSKRETYKSILKLIDGFPTLTISSITGFADEGGDIGFYIEDNKLRFAVNLQSLNKSDIKISSKLLRLAKIINPL
jgi:YfiR/HmsC-like